MNVQAFKFLLEQQKNLLADRKEIRSMRGSQIKMARRASGITLSQLSAIIRREEGIFCCVSEIIEIEREAYLTRKRRRWVEAATRFFYRTGWEFDEYGSHIRIAHT